MCKAFGGENSEKHNMAKADLFSAEVCLEDLITEAPPHLWNTILEISMHQKALQLCLCYWRQGL